MATPNQVSATANKSSTLESVASKHPKPTESGSAPNGTSRSTRGRPNRVRNGGRSSKSVQNTRDDKATASNSGPTSAPPEKPDRPSLPKKPILSITSPSNPPNTTKSKNSSRRPSRANSTINTSQSSPVIETPVSPASSRSSNRRKRSGVGKGNSIPKINPPPSQDNLLRPGRPRLGPVPHTAPVKDPPPHLSHKPSYTPTGSFDMSKDIDALVERVRAVAMADNRPSTPGSHIDWAGDDDDSLPDLDDWGIPSLSDPKAHAISPIIVGGLKPLPDLNPASGNAKGKSTGNNLPDTANDPQHGASHPSPNGDAPSPGAMARKDIQKPSIHPSLPPKPQVTPDVYIVNEIHKPMASHHTQFLEGRKEVPAIAPTHQPTPSEGPLRSDSPASEPCDKANVPTSGDTLRRKDDLSDQDIIGSGGLAQSMHALTAEECPEPEQEGLAASIHAPRAIVDSSSAPAHLGSRSPKFRQTHGRAQTVGRPFPRLSHQNDNNYNRSPRGGYHGSSRHARNHSSPSITNRPSHSRPILTGDAISRLAKVVGSTTIPSTKPTPITND